MSDELYQYYEQELTFFRQMAGEFAARYPKVASRLQLDETKESSDPHVKRLIDSFALIAARVRRKVTTSFLRSSNRSSIFFILTICGPCRRWRSRNSALSLNNPGRPRRP